MNLNKNINLSSGTGTFVVVAIIWGFAGLMFFVGGISFSSVLGGIYTFFAFVVTAPLAGFGLVNAIKERNRLGVILSILANIPLLLAAYAIFFLK